MQIWKCQACALMLAIAGAQQVVHAQCMYGYQTIDYPCDPETTTGVSVNNNGTVVGSFACGVPIYTQAFVWHAETGFEVLDPPIPAMSVYASGINDHGDMCGSLLPVDGEGSWRAFFYDATADSWTLIPPEVATGESQATAINDAGQVVGFRSIEGGHSAFLWSEKEGIIDVGLVDGTSTYGFAVSSNGTLVGRVGLLPVQAFALQEEQLVLLGPVPGGTTSNALGVNETAGMITGTGAVDDFIVPATWTQGAWSFPQLPEWANGGNATSVNSVGQVAGLVRIVGVPNSERAVLWQHGQVHEVAHLVDISEYVVFNHVSDINDEGVILASGYGPDGLTTFLLAPIGRPQEDLDGDCLVGTTDILELLTEWSTPSSSADLNDDGTVDFIDLKILLAAWS